MNYLHNVAQQLADAADRLEAEAGRCNCPAGSYDHGSAHEKGCPERNPTIEQHWARHLREDARSMRLLAEALGEPAPA